MPRYARRGLSLRPRHKAQSSGHDLPAHTGAPPTFYIHALTTARPRGWVISKLGTKHNFTIFHLNANEFTEALLMKKWIRNLEGRSRNGKINTQTRMKKSKGLLSGSREETECGRNWIETERSARIDHDWPSDPNVLLLLAYALPPFSRSLFVCLRMNAALAVALCFCVFCSCVCWPGVYAVLACGYFCLIKSVSACSEVCFVNMSVWAGHKMRFFLGVIS